MEVNSQNIKGVITASVNGRIDAVTAPELEKKLIALISSNEKKIILDMINIDYISSAGLRVVLTIAKKMKVKQGEVILTGLKGSVKEVFEISGFLNIFKLFNSIEDALAQI